MVREKCFIGVDVGTTRVKAVLISKGLGIQSNYSVEHKTHSPKSGWAEQDPRDWWKGAKKAIKKVCYQANVESSRVKALGVSSQSSTVLPVDNKGVPLSNAIIWMDERGESQIDKLESMGEIVSNSNPNPIYDFFTLPKLVWLKKNEPQLFNAANKFIQANSYIVYKLTGEFSLDASEAGLQHIYDINEGEYSESLCKALDFPLKKFPPVKKCTEVVGSIKGEAAEKTGLKKGTPVIAGTVDTAASAIAAGVVSPEQAFFSAGTSGNLCACVEDPFFEDAFFTFPHAFEGTWLIDMLLGAVGATLHWFKDTLAGQEIFAAKLLDNDPYKILDMEASKVKKLENSPIFLPFLKGQYSPNWNREARGCFWGLSMETTKPQLVRSIMEGCSFELLHNLKFLNNQGFESSEIRIVGGITESDIWNQIIADVTGSKISIPKTLGSPLGVAILAGLGTGFYTDIEQPINRHVKIRRTFEPTESGRKLAESRFKTYEKLTNKMPTSPKWGD